MEKLSIPTFTFATRNYCLLTKPGIILGNAITMAGGFALASKGYFNVWLFLVTLLGISLIIASGCVFNNYFDREHDEKMSRTKNRALVTGLISGKNALMFAVFLGILGTFLLAFYTNFLSVMIALFGFFVYVVLYTFSKYYSVHGTLIGSMAGAVPPVVGYCAVSNSFDLAALLLFSMITFWQMPHFFAISIYRLDDYVKASIPVLPIKKGMFITKVQMMLYIVAFIVVTSLLTVFGYTNYSYLVILTFLGFTWLWICIKGFQSNNDKQWARQMFVFSLVIVMILSVMIPFTVIRN